MSVGIRLLKPLFCVIKILVAFHPGVRVGTLAFKLEFSSIEKKNRGISWEMALKKQLISDDLRKLTDSGYPQH